MSTVAPAAEVAARRAASGHPVTAADVVVTDLAEPGATP